MRVFVTGASGYLGTALIPVLREAGHEVVGLARSDRSAERVASLGAAVRRGDLGDPEGLRSAARDADAVIHLAFDNEGLRAGGMERAAAVDLAAVRAIGDELAGTGRSFVGTNATLGMALAGFRGVLTEDSTLPGGARIDSENAVVALAGRGVRAVVVRLPPTVHGDGRFGFASGLIGLAQASGVSGWAGDGGARWPAAHLRDVVELYRLALESAPAGSRLHAVAEEGIPVRAIAEAVARRTGVPARRIDDADVRQHFGFLAPFIGLDGPVSSAATRELTGWSPVEEGLLGDLVP